MSSLIAFIIQIVATGTALRLGRQHRPIAFVFCWGLIAHYAVTRHVPDVIIYAAIATYPAAIVAASWAALQARCRPYLGLLVVALGLTATLIARATDGTDTFGEAMACLWLSCAFLGAAALYRTDAPRVTVVVLGLLLAGLPVEAVGWVAWQAGANIGFELARMISRVTVAIVVVIQVAEGETWRLPWPAVPGLHVERVRQWARTWRRAELPDSKRKSK